MDSVMKRSPNNTKKLVLDHAAVRELKLGDLERTHGGSTTTSGTVTREPVYPPEKPGDDYVVTC
jgi:hypothetical protein